MIIKEKVKDLTPKVNLSNLHGHVCIDLHNHNSGFTERVEADNMVTNALTTLFPYFTKIDQSYFYPIHSRALGGLMLFDNTLNENVNNINFPGDAHIVAFAGQGSDTDRTYKGSLNSVESEALSNGFKTVWDFSTSQANGTIKALSRTHSNIYRFLLGTALVQRSDYQVSTRSGGCHWDKSNGKIYQLISNRIHSMSSMLFNNIPVNFDFVNQFNTFQMSQTQVTTLTNTYTEGACGSSDDEYAYAVTTTGNNLYKIKMANEDFTETNLGTITTPNQFSENHGMGVIGNYLFYPYVTPINYLNHLKIYKVNITNVSDVSEYDVTESILAVTGESEVRSSHYIYSFKNATVFTDGQTYTGIIYSDGTHIITNYYDPTFRGTYSRMPLDGTALFLINSSGYPAVTIQPGYLGTIANIEPVTKTASQSMKITYTLTNE